MNDLIDVHQHLWGAQKIAEYGRENQLEDLLRLNRRNGIRECWLSCVALDGRPWDGSGDRLVEDAFRRYPDEIRGMGFLWLGRHTAAKVREFKERGFFGLKVIFPCAAYGSLEYDEIWAEAVRLRMPVTFHTGEIGSVPPNCPNKNPDDMMPHHLGRVAIAFPELIMILAHMGNTRVSDACALAGRYANVYMDCSGGWLLRDQPKRFWDNVIYWPMAQTKVAYGSDQLFAGIAGEIEHTAKFIENQELTVECADRIWRGVAEEIKCKAGVGK